MLMSFPKTVIAQAIAVFLFAEEIFCEKNTVSQCSFHRTARGPSGLGLRACLLSCWRERQARLALYERGSGFDPAEEPFAELLAPQSAVLAKGPSDIIPLNI